MNITGRERISSHHHQSSRNLNSQMEETTITEFPGRISWKSALTLKKIVNKFEEMDLLESVYNTQFRSLFTAPSCSSQELFTSYFEKKEKAEDPYAPFAYNIYGFAWALQEMISMQGTVGDDEKVNDGNDGKKDDVKEDDEKVEDDVKENDEKVEDDVKENDEKVEDDEKMDDEAKVEDGEKMDDEAKVEDGEKLDGVAKVDDVEVDLKVKVKDLKLKGKDEKSVGVDVKAQTNEEIMGGDDNDDNDDF
ncbi:RNA polymerase II subunit 5-mediating protein homolog [Impatiens glandulifera]|uniref:RNA polymerase II subunit 5-mediating protein homolog n=1 Tax=Impatiens glandulifera TaxID=253017 RepID=UPI001FB105E5|nr:RNA polymerase II subunit 5-mediating protein homolog [Impatiens glandulifera]